jgi:hypothetical protein
LILVVPVALVDQVTLEFHRYLEFGAFDILPCLGTWPNRKVWWKDIWTKAQNPIGRRIVITTPNVRFFSSISYTRSICLQALQSDFDCVYLLPDSKKPSLSPVKKPSFAVHGTATIYGHKFLVAAIDEAHNCRNINKAYWATFALRENAEMAVAMTATPVTTRPSVSYQIRGIRSHR